MSTEEPKVSPKFDQPKVQLQKFMRIRTKS